MRQDPAYADKRDVPLIVYTAYPEEFPERMVRDWGADEYVVKGGDMLPLITALVRRVRPQPQVEARA